MSCKRKADGDGDGNTPLKWSRKQIGVFNRYFFNANEKNNDEENDNADDDRPTHEENVASCARELQLSDEEILVGLIVITVNCYTTAYLVSLSFVFLCSFFGVFLSGVCKRRGKA